MWASLGEVCGLGPHNSPRRKMVEETALHPANKNPSSYEVLECSPQRGCGSTTRSSLASDNGPRQPFEALSSSKPCYCNSPDGHLTAHLYSLARVYSMFCSLL